MRTVLYGSIYANGPLAQATQDHPIAPEVLADFIGRVGSTGNLMVGRRTHDMVTALGAASALAEAGAELVVLSTTARPASGAEVAADPSQALQHLAGRGHEVALIGGGAATYRSFLQAGLVDELIINILPELTGGALDLALPVDQRIDVELASVSSLSSTIAQLNYRVRH